ncbi:PTS system IIB component [Metamycoplasma cloacale]|uniref:PTS glucose transporter subunit IIB n=1 Tax=Metamycoplasma cloacale TaxID=92401 RepID=A0A2Z4LLA0_9BACT|nr:PTS glucose transporter subunit IIB [Metamycoplasma cloacale]AWX42519.1 PTS glucose transporter subunit IIB [Metamycoplasma cloacale]VEU79135.1 PTS system IIB component [Metamycoplasma cloacale]
MNKKHKALYIFLIIITLGFILLHWRKYKQQSIKNELSVEEKIPFDMNDFLDYLGGIENINNVSSSHKIVKIEFKQRSAILAKELQELNGISGITFQRASISLVVGNCAKYLEQQLLKEIK